LGKQAPFGSASLRLRDIHWPDSRRLACLPPLRRAGVRPTRSSFRRYASGQSGRYGAEGSFFQLRPGETRPYCSWRAARQREANRGRRSDHSEGVRGGRGLAQIPGQAIRSLAQRCRLRYSPRNLESFGCAGRGRVRGAGQVLTMPLLDDHEIRRVRELHISLGAVKRCSDCGLSKLVTEFTGYGIPDCHSCLDRARKAREQAEREAKEAAETAARHARHLAQRAASASTICPECLGSKPLHAPLCRWCAGRMRAGVA
jgi:hypothetical protein